MTTKEFDAAHNYRKEVPECCLTCVYSVRWSFKNRYSQQPSKLEAMCFNTDAPHEEIRFGGHVERKYVSPFGKCDCYKKDKELNNV